jgi:hypothetical protein
LKSIPFCLRSFLLFKEHQHSCLVVLIACTHTSFHPGLDESPSSTIWMTGLLIFHFFCTTSSSEETVSLLSDGQAVYEEYETALTFPLNEGCCFGTGYSNTFGWHHWLLGPALFLSASINLTLRPMSYPSDNKSDITLFDVNKI